jgi:magnesium chelatase family protein
MAIEVPAVSAMDMAHALANAPRGEASSIVRERVVAAHGRQVERQGKPNARLVAGEIERFTQATRDAERLIANGMSKLSLSARGYHRVLKVARTIADLAGSAVVEAVHAAEAVAYRREVDARR